MLRKKHHLGRSYNKVLKCVPLLHAINQESTTNIVSSVTHAQVSVNQLGMFQKTLKRRYKKFAKFCIGAHANKAITKKPSEIRMGKGKGAIDSYSFNVSPGFVFGHVYGVTNDRFGNFLKKTNKKMNIKLCSFTNIILKNYIGKPKSRI